MAVASYLSAYLGVVVVRPLGVVGVMGKTRPGPVPHHKVFATAVQHIIDPQGFTQQVSEGLVLDGEEVVVLGVDL